MKNTLLKKADITNIELLQKIGKQTFIETFAQTNTTEDMDKYLIQSFSTKQLSKELNNPYSCFYLAIINDEVVGYLKVNWSKAQTERHDLQAFEIERIYVLNEYHGKKVGQKLYEKALSLAKNRQSTYIWLGVWEKNPKAIRFYEKNGFVVFDKHTFVLGSDIQTDVLMKLHL